MTTSLVYEEVVLRIEADRDKSGFCVQALGSPYGGNPSAPLNLPFKPEQLAGILGALDVTVRGSGEELPLAFRDVRPPERRNADPAFSPPTLGRALFEALFAGPIRENFLTSLALVGNRPNTGLRIRLMIDPELAGPVSALPWELLYRHETRDFLSRQLLTPVVRDLNVQRPKLTPSAIAKLRVLVILSRPVDQAALKAEEEARLIREAWSEAAGVDLDFMEHPSIDDLRQRARQRPFDVLHFIGHGGFESKHEGALYFEDHLKRGAHVTGTVLADTLKGTSTIRLVVINACETACMPRAENGSDPYQGVASSLIMSGIPAVIAMQFPISDGAAITFSKAFYRALAGGDPVESAMVEGRMAIVHARPSSWEWATPVLFLGAQNGELFAIEQAGHDNLAAKPAAPPLQASLELIEIDQHERAVGMLEKIRQTNDQDPLVYYYLALARFGRRRPRAQSLDVIQKAENDLVMATHLFGSVVPPHVAFLQALIKFDFYRMNGLRVKPPTIEELVREARAAEGEPVELRRLLEQVPSPPSPVREAIEEHVRVSALG